ncbi:hypothetical protein [Burkholderia plantarii]|nr:hypothetical protein [Burkholderia plantarii]
MTIGNRGDRLFAAGLSKTMRDAGDLIRTGIGQTSEGACRTRSWRRAGAP